MPSIPIKTADELARQRHAGALLASVFEMLDTFIVPGVSTLDINDRVEAFIVNELQSRPASKGQYNYPYVLNTSVNEVVCHGVPKANEYLKAGAIVNVDITLEKGGLIADSSKMYLIGDVSPLARRLVDISQEAMWLGIKMVKPGAHWETSGMPSRRMLSPTAIALSGNTAGTVSAKKCMKNRRCCTMVNLVQAKCYRQEWFLPSNRW